MKSTGLAVLGLTVALAACSGDGTGEGGPVVAATTDVVHSLVAAVAGGDAAVVRVMPPGTDPHSFQPAPSQVAALRDADLVVASGLGLEEGLEDVLAQAEASGTPVLRLGERLDPIPLGDGAGALDPHWWMDPTRGARATAAVAAALAAADPGGGDAYAGRAAAAAAELEALDAEIAALVGELPEARRKLVTGHDFLRYFAARYGFEVVGTLVPGGSTVAAPSAADLAALGDAIAAAGVPAVFTDATEPGSIGFAGIDGAESVEVVELYAGSLGPEGSGADSYQGMLRTDAAAIVEALAP